ncbi:MAG: hypothetical protein RL556_156 [Actinomycetota bacterium]
MAVGLLASAATMFSIVSGITNLSLEKTRLQAVADTVAIIASDSRQGLVAGVPCENAKRFAELNMSSLQKCFIVSLGAKISVKSQTSAILLIASAQAEPLQQ